MMNTKKILKLLRPHIILLFLSAGGALVVSAHNTLRVMSESGQIDIIGIAAVLTLEVGLAGITFRFRSSGRVWRWFENTALLLSTILLTIFLVTTNVLSQVEVLNVAIPEITVAWVRVIIFGVFIPFLAFVLLHSLRGEIQEAFGEDNTKEKEPTATKVTPRSQRLSIIKDKLEHGETINQTQLAKVWGIQQSTVSRDVAEITKQLEDEKTTSSEF